jgi:hypothetical protein
LESKEFIERENKEIKDILPKDLRKSFENLLKSTEIPIEIEMNGNEEQKNDKILIDFYLKEILKHKSVFENAIQAFILTINRSQPPKVFM